MWTAGDPQGKSERSGTIPTAAVYLPCPYSGTRGRACRTTNRGHQLKKAGGSCLPHQRHRAINLAVPSWAYKNVAYAVLRQPSHLITSAHRTQLKPLRYSQKRNRTHTRPVHRAYIKRPGTTENGATGSSQRGWRTRRRKLRLSSIDANWCAICCHVVTLSGGATTYPLNVIETPPLTKGPFIPWIAPTSAPFSPKKFPTLPSPQRNPRAPQCGEPPQLGHSW